MSTLFIRQLTPDDRYWRIDWFGEFSYPPDQRRSQPSVRVAISPLACDPADTTALLSNTATIQNNQRLAWVPIGILGAVRIGDIWKNGQCALSPNYQTERFTELNIQKKTTDLIKSGLPLDGGFILPLSEHPWHLQQTMSYCLKVKLANDKKIIIPCVELIRFYFGSSSKLLHLLFTRPMSKENFYKSMQFNEATGMLHLKLASGLSGMSAADIGRISLNHDAWRSARLIFDTCMTASAQREPIFPSTRFPFIGNTTLIATGKWLPHNHYRNSIKADPAWLVINEPGYSLFTLWCGGDCISLNGVCHDSLSELPLLLDRENLACSLPESCNTVYLHAPACRDFSTVQKTKYEVNLLGRAVPDDFPSSSDGLYAIAMNGAL